MSTPPDLQYTKEHEWVKIDDGKARIGITSYAQKELGDIVFVDLPAIDSDIKATDSFGVVESLKTVSELYSPLTGKISEVNQNLDETPELVNASPYENGWMIVIEMADPSECETLMDATAYEEYIKGLE